MKLEITSTNPILTRGFAEHLIKFIRIRILATLDTRKLKMWNSYISSLDEYKSDVLIDGVDCEKIIYLGINNLVYKIMPEKIIIEINPNIYITGLDHVSVEKSCKMINYGTAEMIPYPIFTNTFDYVAKNISRFVRDYYGLGEI